MSPSAAFSLMPIAFDGPPSVVAMRLSLEAPVAAMGDLLPAIVLVSTGLVGMGLAEWIRGEGGRAGEAGGRTDGGEALFAGGDDDGLDDFDDIQDLGGGDEDDEFADDAFGDDADTDRQLEPRIDELEQELNRLSSAVSAVQAENDSIGESVSDIEENIRKLLDIYEMVTEGVNPFVDTNEGAVLDSGADDLFDANDGDSSDDTGIEDLDKALASSEGAGFFSEDAREEEANDHTRSDSGAPADETDSAAESSPVSSGGGDTGKTFEELKSEYESAGTDWTPGEPTSKDPDRQSRTTAERSTGSAVEHDDSDASDAPRDEAASRRREPGSMGDRSGRGDRKPYLPRLPGGYVAELVIMEWIGYLHEHADAGGTLRAITYYENIDWIGREAAEGLRKAVQGVRSSEGDRSPKSGPRLTIDHHVRSLEYIGQLAGNDLDAAAIDAWSTEGGRGL
ncbi:MAG: FlaD/FlaE family flagellar protein [Halobacteriales archaeon]|nr:FlaD/FlaE family flagellar protein [Halobacteriales archaeon]